MKKNFVRIIVVFSAIVLCCSIFLQNGTDDYDAKIYYVDHSMLRLIPVDMKIENTTKEKAVKKIVEQLVDGRDRNKKILRVIPNEDDCISVKVKKNTAIVNLKEPFIKNKPENKIHGLLCVYQIVNSLTSIKGVDTVKFLIDGEEDKGFIKDLDLRETFIPDYYM